MTTTFDIIAPDANIDSSPVFGRIATFTFPAMRHDDLVAIANEFEFETTVPSTGYNVAVNRAVEAEAAGFKSGNYRRFARKIRENITELVQEVIIPAQEGEVKGQRETVARVIVTGGKYVIRPENEKGLEWLEAEGAGARFDARVVYEYETVPAGLVGQWADDVVINEIGGEALDNRGHSFHVLANRAGYFDKFLARMVEASNGHEKLFVAKTVDNSPETLASLIHSFRANLNDAIETAQAAVSKASTKRGVEGAIRRLQGMKARIDKYSALFGQEAEKMHELLTKACDSITTGEIIKEYGDLTG